MGNCCDGSSDSPDGEPNERTPIWPHTTPVQPIPGNSSSLSKTDEESALNKILQKTANDVIDVTYIEPHSLENAEVRGRAREYHSQVASMRGVSRQANKLPTPNQSSLTILSEELASPTDIKFMTDRTEAASDALSSMEIKNGEPLVVQFASP